MIDLMKDGSWPNMLVGTLVMAGVLALAGVTEFSYYLVVIIPMFLEGMNCALENAVDFAGRQIDERARKAKDMAAATVFLSIILAVGTTVYVSAPRLFAKYIAR